MPQLHRERRHHRRGFGAGMSLCRRARHRWRLSPSSPRSTTDQPLALQDAAVLRAPVRWSASRHAGHGPARRPDPVDAVDGAGLFLVGTLADGRFPPLNGFVSEWLTLQAMLRSADWSDRRANRLRAAGAGSRSPRRSRSPLREAVRDELPRHAPLDPRFPSVRRRRGALRRWRSSRSSVLVSVCCADVRDPQRSTGADSDRGSTRGRCSGPTFFASAPGHDTCPASSSSFTISAHRSATALPGRGLVVLHRGGAESGGVRDVHLVHAAAGARRVAPSRLGRSLAPHARRIAAAAALGRRRAAPAARDDLHRDRLFQPGTRYLRRDLPAHRRSRTRARPLRTLQHGDPPGVRGATRRRALRRRPAGGRCRELGGARRACTTAGSMRTRRTCSSRSSSSSPWPGWRERRRSSAQRALAMAGDATGRLAGRADRAFIRAGRDAGKSDARRRPRAAGRG